MPTSITNVLFHELYTIFQKSVYYKKSNSLLSLTETAHSFVPICLHYSIPANLMPLTNTRD